MEVLPCTELPDMGMDDFNYLQQWMNSITDVSVIPMAGAFERDLQNSSFTTFTETIIGRPTKQAKTSSWDSCIIDPIPTSQTISFANSNHIATLKPKPETVSIENNNYASKHDHGRNKINTNTRNYQTSQDHIIAERNRREKLSQRFIALSAIVPGLKKTDKATVLGDAIKHMKHLQERVMILEEETKKRKIESVVLVSKSQIFTEEGFLERTYDEPLPEIEARFSDENVLIKIHCEKKKGVMEKIMADIEKLRLTVLNSSVLSFGSSALDVTIIARIDTEFCIAGKDLVKILRSSLLNFM